MPESYTILMAWCPRHPELPKHIYPRIELQADTPAEAAVRAYETHRVSPCPFTGEEIAILVEQMEDTDDTLLYVYYAQLEIEGKGVYQFGVWDTNDSCEDGENDDETE